MSRINVDDFAFDDVRFQLLAERLGFADGLHALVHCQLVWRQCAQRGTHYLTPVEIALAMRQPAGRAGEVAGALLECELAQKSVSGDCERLYMRGTEGRIEWLEGQRLTQRERARLGGIARAKQAERLQSGRFAPASLDQPGAPAYPAAPAALAPAPSPALRLSVVGSDEPTVPDRPRKPRKPPKAHPDRKALIDRVSELYQERTGEKHDWGGKQRGIAERLVSRHGLDACVKRAETLFKHPPSWMTGPVDIGTLESNWNRLLPSTTWHDLPELDEQPLPPGVEDWR